MRTRICDLLGIDLPIVGFTPSPEVAAAISRAGGLGVLGAIRYTREDELAEALDWMDDHVQGRPYGLDIVIPAHYHGSTVGVTIAFMGLAYYLLPRLGFGPLPPRMTWLQPYLYGGGQLLHIIGLAWTGGYGVQRKTAGLAQGVDRLGEIAGMGLMGFGGLVSVIGGLLFLIVCYRSIRGRRPEERR